MVSAAWLRLESPADDAALAVYVVALALLPSLARRPARRALALGGALVLAAAVSFDTAPWDAAAAFRDGFLAFYDERLPIDPKVSPEQGGVLLLAAFAFTAALALAVRADRPLAGAVVVLVGAGWPVTLLGGGLEWGAFILAAALVVLARRREAIVAGAAVVAAAVAASTSAAVVREGVLHWQAWDFYDRAAVPVGVDYVWDSSYQGVEFPKKKTTVLRIQAGPERVYWRATTLDTFDGQRWIEDTKPPVEPDFQNDAAEVTSEPLLPPRAALRSSWRRQLVTVRALRDEHLTAAATPVAYFAPGLDVRYGWGGVAHVDGLVPQGYQYVAWSFTPRPTPKQLARAGTRYPEADLRHGGYLRPAPLISVRPFGTRGRDADIEEEFHTGFLPRTYEPLWRTARRVVGRPRTPYAAVIALETWFRESGGFTYDEHPPKPLFDVHPPPALVDFVTRGKRGYCQHFAGAMALMLRYLGIPARVAAGFTSGKYDKRTSTWTVTDHNAHTWVEAWFPGWGWLPFDPTPLRGELSGTYTASSGTFAAPDVLGLLDRRGAAAQLLRKEQLEARRARLAANGQTAARTGRSAGAVVAAVLLAGLALLVAAKQARRRARYVGRDARGIARACRAELHGFLADQGVRVPASATASELAALVEDRFGTRADRFAAALTAARYGRGDPGRARRELRDLVRRLRAHLPAHRRLRGLLSLRSLA